MERQVYNVSYNGLDKETRIDCLAEIRGRENPSGYTVLDLDNLRKGSRSTKEDAKNCGEEPITTLGKFIHVDLDLDENLNTKTINHVKKKTYKV